MRTFIVIVVASLIPVGMWTAGCRQDNRQAAFPKTPEMKGLAKAEVSSRAAEAPPVIPPAPIDRDILNLPENAALARVNAVNDRANQIAKPKTPEGLFTLPDNQDHFAMAAPAPEHQPAPAAIQPIPSAREFWSRPVAPAARRSLDVPEDIQAMAAPAPVDPVMAPPAPYLAPIPSSPAALPVENVPGLFDGSPVSMRSGSPPTPDASYGGLFPKGDALGAAPLSSREGPLRLDVAALVGGEETGSMAVASPAIDPSIVVRSTIPAEYEPLPEPIPLEEYNKTHALALAVPDPAPPASLAAMPPPPLPSLDAEPTLAVSGKKTAADALAIDPAALIAPVFLGGARGDAPAARSVRPAPPIPDAGEVTRALAPLPDISRLGKTPARAASAHRAPPAKAKAEVRTTERKTSAVMLPPPVAPEAAPDPELTVARTELLRLDGLAETDGAKGGTGDAAFFKTDFWERKPAAEKRAFAAEMPEPARAPVKPAAETSPVIAAVADGNAKKAAPQKVKLQPVRRKELGRIDSAAEAPPLR